MTMSDWGQHSVNLKICQQQSGAPVTVFGLCLLLLITLLIISVHFLAKMALMQRDNGATVSKILMHNGRAYETVWQCCM